MFEEYTELTFEGFPFKAFTRWDEFLRRFMDASSSNREFRELYNALVIDLAQRAFFHEPEGPEDAQ